MNSALTLGSQEDVTAALELARQHKARGTIGKYVNSPGQPRTSRLDDDLTLFAGQQL